MSDVLLMGLIMLSGFGILIAALDTLRIKRHIGNTLKIHHKKFAHRASNSLQRLHEVQTITTVHVDTRIDAETLNRH